MDHATLEARSFALAAQLHAMGIRHVATLHNFGALEPSLVERSMTLFAREVMPAVANDATPRKWRLVPNGFHTEIVRQGIYGFRSDPVQTNGFLKCQGIVFSPSIHFRNYINHFP